MARIDDVRQLENALPMLGKLGSPIPLALIGRARRPPLNRQINPFIAGAVRLAPLSRPRAICHAFPPWK